MKTVALLIALLSSSAAIAETWISATTVSYHLDRSQRFNETNPGLGVEHDLTENVRAVAGFYRNSIFRESAYAGVAYTPINAGYFRAGVVAGAITGYMISPAPMAIPVVMFEGKHFGANILFVPHVIKDIPATIGFQIKLKMN